MDRVEHAPGLATKIWFHVSLIMKPYVGVIHQCYW
jgi:hypothetical protein